MAKTAVSCDNMDILGDFHIYNSCMKKLLNALLLSLALVFSLLFYTKADSSVNCNGFSIQYIDVGQGDAALIQCDGEYMLIDGGPSDVSSVIYTILKNNGIDRLKYMVATHPDADHIGGLSGALNYAKVEMCFCPVTEHDTKTFSSLVKYLTKQKVNITVPKVGDRYQLGSAEVAILGPVIVSDDSNNSSIIVRITYGNNSFIFMADAEAEEESQILGTYQNIKSDVIKVGHHGSNSSTSKALIDAINPKYAIISVGAGNSYGHPTGEVLDLLSKANVAVYRTDLNGDIFVTSDGNNISIVTKKNVTTAQTSKKTEVTTVPATSTNAGDNITYVLNTNSKKFHSPSCSSVNDMKAKNRKDVSISRDEVMALGYVPCKRCNP